MKFYDNTYHVLHRFNKRLYNDWCKKEVIKYLYTPFIPLLKKALLDEYLGISFTFQKSKFDYGSGVLVFNDAFLRDYSFNFEDLIRQCKKYGKPYSLTSEAYDTFRYETRTILISLAGILDDVSFIPYLREIALHDKHLHVREKAVESLFDIGTKEAVYEGFYALFGAGITHIPTQSCITSKIDELYDFKFSSTNENLLPIFVKFFCQPSFATGLKENGTPGSVGDDEVRLIRHLFTIALKIGTKKSIQFIIEFGLKSPFVDIQAIAQTALLHTPKKLRNTSPLINLVRNADLNTLRRFSIFNINEKGGRLFADGMIGGLVTMKW